MSEDHDAGSFIGLLHLTVEKQSCAVRKMKRVHDTWLGGLHLEDGFWYYKPSDSSKSCDCWYDLTFFDFIQDQAIDKTMFNTVCENLDRGKCKHVLEHYQDGGAVPSDIAAYCSTTIMHAAAASGNKAVVKYLTSIDNQLIYQSLENGFKPLHIAIIKSQSKVIKYLYKCNFRGRTEKHENFFFNRLVLVKRDSETGTLSTVRFPEEPDISNAGYLLSVYNITDLKTVEKLVKVCGLDKNSTDLERTLTFLVQHDVPDIAMLVLSTKHLNRDTLFRSHADGGELILACVLRDADKLLQKLMAKDVDVQFKSQCYNMLDVAHAVGSKGCAAVLEKYMAPTQDVHKKLSPYNFLTLMSLRYGYKINADDPKILTKCAQQGFDVDCIDEMCGKPPIHVAIEHHKADFVKSLLELGSDIDTKHNGENVLSLSIKNRLNGFVFPCECGSQLNKIFIVLFLKDFLYYNPCPQSDQTILYDIVKYDLNSSFLHYVDSATKITFRADDANEKPNVIAETLEDRLLALSAFALLYELGFFADHSCKEYTKKMIEDTLFQPFHSGRFIAHSILLDYVVNITSHPRSLKSSCRIAIRKAHPGHALHAYLSDITFPQPLVDYIIRPCILRPTVVQCGYM